MLQQKEYIRLVKSFSILNLCISSLLILNFLMILSDKEEEPKYFLFHNLGHPFYLGLNCPSVNSRLLIPLVLQALSFGLMRQYSRRFNEPKIKNVEVYFGCSIVFLGLFLLANWMIYFSREPSKKVIAGVFLPFWVYNIVITSVFLSQL